MWLANRLKIWDEQKHAAEGGNVERGEKGEHVEHKGVEHKAYKAYLCASVTYEKMRRSHIGRVSTAVLVLQQLHSARSG